MKKLVTIVTLTTLLAGLAVLGLSDTDISIVDVSVPDNEVVSSVSKAGNASAIAAIAITMTGTPNE